MVVVLGRIYALMLLLIALGLDERIDEVSFVVLVVYDDNDDNDDNDDVSSNSSNSSSTLIGHCARQGRSLDDAYQEFQC